VIGSFRCAVIGALAIGHRAFRYAVLGSFRCAVIGAKAGDN